MAIESKCTEHLRPHRPRHLEAYKQAIHERAHKSWQRFYESLLRSRSEFRLLDAAQLVKHYLGLKRRLGDNHGALIYIYWEPSNGAHVATVAEHKAELERMRGEVADPKLCFDALTYADLWREWGRAPGPPWLVDHLAYLEKRYAVGI